MLSHSGKGDFYIKPLADEAAIEKGIEVFLEVFFVYFMLTVLTIHEMKR